MTTQSVEQTTAVPRKEYPRPQFYRENWLNLNGDWEFEFDDKNIGFYKKWYKEHDFSKQITVPFSYQSNLSGIGNTEFHDVVWYRRTFSIPDSFAGKRTILHFGAVDYRASVWVNGQFAVAHEGGHTPFSTDITDLLIPGENVLVVRAEDFSKDLDQPRGKQYWEEKSASIFYTRTTGIWQTVWLEAVSDTYLKHVKFTPDIDAGEVILDIQLNQGLIDRNNLLSVDVDIRFKDQLVAQDRIHFTDKSVRRRIGLPDFSSRLWSPEHPNLYDVVLRLHKGENELDVVQSYFGMRKISVENGRVLLNNHPYYMKLVLDQGYFPEGILTPPSDEEIRQDVELTKQMGFNGARKHQKVEDPRYLYWCDKLGLLVWGEMANSYIFTDDAVRRITSEWQEVIHRDYSHPCIVAWVPLNESWGVPRLLTDARHRAHATSLYYLTKSLDATRLVISNDGWEHTVSDLCTIHDYDSRKESLMKRYATPETAVTSTPSRHFIYAPGYSYQGEPILVTEFGGISFKKSEWEGWGYSGAETEEDFIKRYAAVVHGLLESPTVQGFCYTQLTDVEQEINGLLTYDRRPKVDLDIIKTINEGRIPIKMEHTSLEG